MRISSRYLSSSKNTHVSENQHTHCSHVQQSSRVLGVPRLTSPSTHADASSHAMLIKTCTFFSRHGAPAHPTSRVQRQETKTPMTCLLATFTACGRFYRTLRDPVSVNPTLHRAGKSGKPRSQDCQEHSFHLAKPQRPDVTVVPTPSLRTAVQLIAQRCQLSALSALTQVLTVRMLSDITRCQPSAKTVCTPTFYTVG